MNTLIHTDESLKYCFTDFHLSAVGQTGIHACGDDVRLPMEAVVAEAGTTRHEIGAGIP